MNKKYLHLGKELTRNESKQILGSEGGDYCAEGRLCQLYVADGRSGVSYDGNCASGWGGGSGGYMECGCETIYGPYVPSNQGGTQCRVRG